MDNLAGKGLDLLWYALGVTLTATLIGGVLSPLRGGGWVTVKFVLFFIGFALFGYASITLWRARPSIPTSLMSPACRSACQRGSGRRSSRCWPASCRHSTRSPRPKTGSHRR